MIPGADSVIAQAAHSIVLPPETIPESPAGSGIGNAPFIANDWAPSNGAKLETGLAIALENVAHGYEKPNILDVKLGARLWDDEAPIAKREKLDSVAETSTSKPLGFRIAGMKTYHGIAANVDTDVTSEGYKVYDKMYGRAFTADNVVDGFGDYFLLGKGARPTVPIRKVIKRFTRDLRDIQQVMRAEESRMYSASLLFVYEGDRQALHDAFETEKHKLESVQNQATSTNGNANGDGPGTSDDEDTEGQPIQLPDIQSLKLIDFAHARWTPGEGPDENVLHGIGNVIKTLEKLIG